MLKENVNPVLGCGTLSCKSILGMNGVSLYGCSLTLINRASQVTFLQTILYRFVFTQSGLLVVLKSPGAPGLGHLARECSWEPNYFTFVKTKQIKSVFNLLVKLKLSHPLRHNMINKLTFCSLKSKYVLC